MELTSTFTIIQKRKGLKTHILEGEHALCRRLSLENAGVQFAGEISQVTCETCKNAYSKKTGKIDELEPSSLNNTEKARQLYKKCETNWSENTLIPYHFKKFNYYKKFNENKLYIAMFMGIVLNHYAHNEFPEDWIPFHRQMFNIDPMDKKGWKDYQRVVYKLTKKRIIETKEMNGEIFIRLVEDNLFDPNIYALR